MDAVTNCILPLSGEIPHDSTSQHASLSQSRFWREFIAGMAMLRSQVGRVNANLRQIAKSNLKLLHRNFLDHSEYRNFLAEGKNSPHTQWQPLARHGDIHCGVLNLGSILLQADTDTDIIQELVRQSNSTSNGNATPGLMMLYVISGKLAVEQLQTPIVMNKQHGNNGGKTTRNILKAGQASVSSIEQNINNLSSASSNCQVLVVSTLAS